MKAILINTCSDCNMFNRKNKHCGEWNRPAEGGDAACRGAQTGLIGAHMSQPDNIKQVQDLVDQANALLEKEENEKGV